MSDQQHLVPMLGHDDDGDSDDDLTLLMVPPPIGTRFQRKASLSSISCLPFSKLISCFASERPKSYQNLSNNNNGWLWHKLGRLSRRIQRPFGKTHLLVHLFYLCLGIRAIYCLFAVALAPSLGIRWVQANFLFLSVLVSFGILSLLTSFTSNSSRIRKSNLLERFLKLMTAAKVEGIEKDGSGSMQKVVFAGLLVAFCFYIWSIASSTETFFNGGYYSLLFSSHEGNGTATKGERIISRIAFVLVSGTSFANAMLCGLAICLHLFIGNAIHRTYCQFIHMLEEKIVTRQIAFGTELETMLRRSDNLVRFTFFARCRFAKLGWAALLVSASVNACIVALFFQFDESKARNMLLFANKYTNNLLSTFLLLCSAAFLGVYLSVLKMDRKLYRMKQLLVLDNTFPNVFSPNTKMLAQGLLDRLEQANSHQICFHFINLLFCVQFFAVFAIIGILHFSLIQVVTSVFSAISASLVGMTLWFKGQKLINFFTLKPKGKQ